jgi:hypothetical protein
MMKTPRCEGDQEVTIPESNLTDAAKGSGSAPLLALNANAAGLLLVFTLSPRQSQYQPL